MTVTVKSGIGQTEFPIDALTLSELEVVTDFVGLLIINGATDISVIVA